MLPVFDMIASHHPTEPIRYTFTKTRCTWSHPNVTETLNALSSLTFEKKWLVPSSRRMLLRRRLKRMSLQQLNVAYSADSDQWTMATSMRVCVCVRVCHTIVTFNCHVCLFFNGIITCKDPESRLPVIFIINIITIITTATVTVSYVMSLLFIAATDDAAPHRCQVATLASHAFPNILPMIQTCCRKRGLSKRIRIHDSWTHKILLNFRQI